MESPLAYIPMDRRQALAHGHTLPEQTSGTALFADISGFTPLTESLVRALGPQRGAEELPRQLNRVYDALVAEVDRYGGSVLGFAGDAITCWFDAIAPAASEGGTSDADPRGAAHRAATCALALQQAMAAFEELEVAGAGRFRLAIKVGVASGAVRRFLVGDPSIQILDVLAGDTLQRMAEAEHLAQQGQVVFDEATALALGELANVGEWHVDPAGSARFAVLHGLRTVAAPAPWPTLPETALDATAYRQWMLPPIFERLQVGMGEFLTELRPVVALFVRFGGIDYDHDPDAQTKLNDFMLQAQRMLRTYDAYVLQLTIGDKGSFFYAAFGSPVAHEDDPVRAVMAALELREWQVDYLDQFQIGLSQGRARTGAYGGITRRTYGVLGDEVNMAARLMQHATVGQVLVSHTLWRATGDRFTWEPLAPIMVKGKSEPVATYRLISADRDTIRLHEPRYVLPMVGRETELAFVLGRLEMAQRGDGQVVGIVAEAGMGKSRLVAEVVRAASRQNLVVYGGACQSYGTNTPYLVWQNVWRAFFGLDPRATVAAQINSLATELEQLDATLVPRLPLLGAILNISIPDNELTIDFGAKLRKESLEALLVTCLRARASIHPLMIVLEDCHWMDALSHDLLEVLGRTLSTMPVLILMAYRPLQSEQRIKRVITQMPSFRAVPLDNLLPDEVATLVQLKLQQFFGTLEAIPEHLIEQVNARTQGNPFYVEELLNFMRDQGIDPRDPGVLSSLELPPSLHSLILSRVDRLTESQRNLLKVASVIGRLFPATILWGMGSFLGQQERVRRELENLSTLELTPLDSPDPELTYLFKHIVTQEVTYESLSFATRAMLHEQIGHYLEQRNAGEEQLVDLLAFHYDRSENVGKRREYLWRAGVAAQLIYANAATIDYLTRLLALVPPEAQIEPLLRLGNVLDLVGRWDEAYLRYELALNLALAQDQPRDAALARALIGELLRKQGRFAEAQPWLDEAMTAFTLLNDQAGLAETLNYAGTTAMHTGEYALAQAHYEASLAIQRECGDLIMQGKALSNLGIVAFHQGDVDRARHSFEASLAVRREAGNPLWIANSLGNLGMLAIEIGDYKVARGYIEESLALERATGDRHAIAISLNNLGKVATAEGDYATARLLYREALTINADLGDRWALPYLLEDVGVLAGLTGQPERALCLAAAAASLREATGSPLSSPEQAQLDEALAPARMALSQEQQAAAYAHGQTLTTDEAVAEARLV
ncbi:tetratricopeptide repeat protein [Candidatus Chloroploca asiatica]|uniref:Guanylate cyclase domain-containing protein n=1 Tax=Candidatus Chloroploca asiatica TaxID=1506545 RepID=A0A2H3KLA1_9CHLR|nr:tetratricopeptide repeat protein [Candidatus Chloroploca asiatica]PDV98780.1 hypothetical protein A9Q02_02270 [Candidatus Chloroploca asiatica]